MIYFQRPFTPSTSPASLPNSADPPNGYSISKVRPGVNHRLKPSTGQDVVYMTTNLVPGMILVIKIILLY